MSSDTRYNARDAFENIFKEEGIQYPIENEIELVDLSKKGITKGALKRIAECGGFSTKDLALILPVSERTLHRYKENERMSGDLSERALLIAKVLVKGAKVFGTEKDMREWIRGSVFALGGRTPLSIMDTVSGLQLVLDVLGRLEHGVYS